MIVVFMIWFMGLWFVMTFFESLMWPTDIKILRILSFLETLKKINPKKEIFLAREMTKLHESFYRGSVASVIEQLSSQKDALRGEFVLVIGSNKKTASKDFLTNEQEKVIQVLLKSMKTNEALNLASKSFGIKKNSLYKLLLKEK